MIGRGRNLALRREQIDLDVRSETAIRLDVYVLHHLDWKSRSRIQRLIRSGHVRVNGEATKASRKVSTGDVVTLHLSDGTGIPQTFADREFPRLYEDPWLVVVSKPPGILVHPVGRHVYDTLINYLHHEYHGEKTPDGHCVVPRLCHRIDRDTTGALVIAKDSFVHRAVQWQFERRHVEKEYTTLVRGQFPRHHTETHLPTNDRPPKEAKTVIDIPLGEGNDLRSCLSHRTLKVSRTDVRVLERFDDYTLLSCRPLTGRQNQIRVHLAALGYPVVGDDRYGCGREPDEMFPDRYLLHSRRVRFFHPRCKSMVELDAALPADFEATLESLRPVRRAAR